MNLVSESRSLQIMSTSSQSDTITDNFQTTVKNQNQCLQLARSICDSHRMSTDCTRIPEASRLVFETADHCIIKIFPPEDIEFFQTEELFLTKLHGKLPVQTPEFIDSGNREQYPYIIMRKLDGVPLKQITQDLSDTNWQYMCTELGEIVRALHDLPIDLFSGAPFQWMPLIENQRESLLQRHREFGMPPEWIKQLEKYTADCPEELLHPERLMPLHTELMQEHLFVSKQGSQWKLTGLIDFEPSMTGNAEYEFCAAGIFLTQGRKKLFRRLLSSYGYDANALTPALSRRIMILLLLHRYGNVHRFLNQLPGLPQFSTLEELEQYWFGL